MGAALVIVAFSIDCFEMLLEWLGIGIFGLSSLLSVCASVLFWIWFKMLNVPFIASPKKFFTMASTSLLEIIPGLDAVGGFLWTAGTIILVIMVRLEDRGGAVGKLSGTAMTMMKTRYNTYESVKVKNIKRLSPNTLDLKDKYREMPGNESGA